MLYASIVSMVGEIPRLRAVVDAISAAEKLAFRPTGSPVEHRVFDAAVAGKLDGDALTRMVTDEAHVILAHQKVAELSNGILRTGLDRFHRELLNGGCDEILDKLRPRFDKSLATARKCLGALDLSRPLADFIDNANAEQLGAWRDCKAAVEELDRISAFLVHLSPGRSSAFPMFGLPSGLHLESVVQQSFWFGDGVVEEISDHFRARNSTDWRASPFLRLGTVSKLRTLAETKEAVRDLAELTWSMRIRSHAGGRLRNPYAIADEPADLAALRAEAIKHHPDAGGDPDKFREAFLRYDQARTAAKKATPKPVAAGIGRGRRGGHPGD